MSADLTVVPIAPPTETKPIDVELEELARALITKARGKDVGLTEQLDTFKAVAAYHTNILKAQGKLKPGNDDDSEASLKGAKERIQNAQ